MRTQSEWIVEISGRSSRLFPAGPRTVFFGFRYALARAIISRAALLVNVTARIRDGRDPRHTR